MMKKGEADEQVLQPRRRSTAAVASHRDLPHSNREYSNAEEVDDIDTMAGEPLICRPCGMEDQPDPPQIDSSACTEAAQHSSQRFAALLPLFVASASAAATWSAATWKFEGKIGIACGLVAVLLPVVSLLRWLGAGKALRRQLAKWHMLGLVANAGMVALVGSMCVVEPPHSQGGTCACPFCAF